MQNKYASDSIEKYAKFWKKKFKKKKKKLQKRRKNLLKYSEICSTTLIKEFHVEKVFLIGSLACKSKIHEKSDIDLVVEGLKSQNYFKALNRLFEIIPKKMNVDLITYENVSDQMKKIIDTQGVRLK